MEFSFLVVGSGRQGRAVAADLLLYTESARVILADWSKEIVDQSAAFILSQPGCDTPEAKSRFSTIVADVRSDSSLDRAIQASDVVLGCVPYRLHPMVAEAAIRNSKHYFDLGMDTPDTQALRNRVEEIAQKGIVVVPDCGLAPGIVNYLGADAIGRHGDAESVHLYCGVLPQDRNRPLGYKLAFSMEGLIGEYEDLSYVLRDGELTEIGSLVEREEFDVPGVGKVEAFVTSGGSGTSPDLYVGQLKSYEYKTIRYPGHMEAMKLFQSLGFWSDEPIKIDGKEISPREAFTSTIERSLTDSSALDLCIIIARAQGNGRVVQASLVERQKPGDAFTTMERLTAYGLTIPVLNAIHSGLRPGVSRPEELITSSELDRQLRLRGVEVVWSGF